MAQFYVRPGIFESDPLLFGELVQVGVNAFDVTVFGKELGGSLFPDSLHSGDVVRRVSAEGEYVNDLRG